jgi:hypothetical protein
VCTAYTVGRVWKAVAEACLHGYAKPRIYARVWR